MEKQELKTGETRPAPVDQDDVLMDSDDDHDTRDSRSPKRLKKSAAVLEDEGYDSNVSNTNSGFKREGGRGGGGGKDGRGSKTPSSLRPYGRGEIGQQGVRQDRSHSHHSHRSNSSGSRYRASPSSSASYNIKKIRSDSKDSSSSPSRSVSRSNSPSERQRSPTYYERLKAVWGKEPWQDFELLQNNVLGPGGKAPVGPGALPTTALGKGDLDKDMEELECNCIPIGNINAPTCYDASCHNFATMQECREGKCHPGCRNQRIQRRENAKVEVFKAEGKGMGLRLLAPVSKGHFIAEYVGEIINRKELNKRMISSAGTRKLYMMQLGDNTYLDAKRKGGIARFVNHSCEPTCRLEQWTAIGEPRCAVFTLRAMEAGEELSFDYQWEAHELRQATKCLCGAPSCRGTIEVLNPNAESGGGPFARGRVKASAMGVWRTPNEGEYANPEGLIDRKVRVYFDGDCTYFEAKVMRFKPEKKKHMLLYVGEGDSINDELEEDLVGVQGKIQGIDKWQIWEESDRVVNIKKKDQTNGTASALGGSVRAKMIGQQGQQGDPSKMGKSTNKRRHFASRFGPQLQLQPGKSSRGFQGMMAGPPIPQRPPPPPPPPPPLPPSIGPRVAEDLLVPWKVIPQVNSDSELVRRIKGRISVHLELVELEDPRASQCPSSQRLLRVAGGRDQVGDRSREWLGSAEIPGFQGVREEMPQVACCSQLLYDQSCSRSLMNVCTKVKVAVDMLRAEVQSLRPLEEWLVAERRRKAQEAAETKDLEADANAQVNRTRQRWCIGSDWHCFSKTVVSIIANNKVVADLRRNALHVVRQVAESGAGKASNSAPLIFHASILIHRYLAIINVMSMSDTPATTVTGTATARASEKATSNGFSNKITAGTSGGSGKDAGGKDSGSANGAASVSNGSSSVSASAAASSSSSSTVGGGGGACGAAGRFRMETNFYVLATACLLLANKSLRARVGSARPRRRDELLRAAYGVQFRGRVLEKGTAENAKWESKLAAAEMEVLMSLGFDVHVTDPLEALDQQRVQKFITAACHSKASSLVVESVTQGCSAWLRFEPDVVALSVLLLAIGITRSRDELTTRAKTLAVNAESTWPAVLACTQSLVRSLPSLGAVPDAKRRSEELATALRQVPPADPMQYPDYEPPLITAQKRLRQRRRAEDGVLDAELRTTDLLMMRKAQDRAGLHGDLGGLQGIKGMAGFGSTLASNKFVRAAIREEVWRAA